MLRLSDLFLAHAPGGCLRFFLACGILVDPEHPRQVSWLGIGLIVVVSLSTVVWAVLAFGNRPRGVKGKVGRAALDSEAQFRTLAEAIPQIVFTTTPDGMNEYSNRRWYELTQLSEEQSVGMNWSQVIHPDDLSVCIADWKRAVATGQPLESEYRIRNHEQQYRWFLVRATPMRNCGGEIVKWFGTCTDIEEQKHHLQILEEQIKERTMELAEANARLQGEMWERDSARKELDRQNAQMMASLTERSQRATLLAKMGELMQSCITKEEVFDAALGFAPKIFPAARGAVALLNPERSLVEVIGSWADCLLPERVFESSACWALRTGHTHLVVAGDPTAPCGHAAGVKHTYMCIPILAQGEALGILHFQTTDEAPAVAAEELSFKTTFAGQIGLSIANIRLREALRNQSIRDALTGLYNRRYLQEMLDREVRRATRAKQPLGVLMLDLDHFKRFNDTFGHEAGDAVLRAAGAFLAQNTRAEDIVCRFGGEEFVVILPTADLEASRSRAERIRSKLGELKVAHQEQLLEKITVSIGVAALPVNGSSPRELLEAADAALYRAKREGRDRVITAPANGETKSAAAAGTTPK